MKASESPYRKIQWVPTGYTQLDKILGGGIPLRRITEISGKYGVGKSTLAYAIIAAAQKERLDTLWADTEFSFGDDYAEMNGVEPTQLDLIQEHLAEDVLDMLEEWVSKHKNAVVVLDSIGGLLTKEQAEKGVGEKVIGGQAKVVATFCRKITPLLAMNNVALVVLNHEFTDLMSGRLMTSGGAKLGYHKSIWLRLVPASKRLMKGEEQIGEVIQAEIRKNKLAPTMKQSVELQLIYGEGFNRQADLLEDALTKGVIRKEGQSYFIGEEKICRGLPALREWFKNEKNEKKTYALLQSM